MWCINCQQDVPAIAHGDMARCAQCGRFLKRRPEAPALSQGESWSESASSAPELPLSVAETTPLLPITPIASAVELENDWALQLRVRHLQRRLRLDEASLTPASFHNELLSPSTIPNLSASHNNQLARMPGRFSAFIAWFAIITGSLTFLGGATLLVWWFLDGSRELWSLGLPLTVAGQFGLLFGLMLQLNRLGRANRRIAESLRHFDDQLGGMNPTMQSPIKHTALPAFTHPSRSPATHF